MLLNPFQRIAGIFTVFVPPVFIIFIAMQAASSERELLFFVIFPLFSIISLLTFYNAKRYYLYDDEFKIKALLSNSIRDQFFMIQIQEAKYYDAIAYKYVVLIFKDESPRKQFRIPIEFDYKKDLDLVFEKHNIPWK